MSTEHKAYEQILTDPDVLADYTCEFFGENGPYPVEEENAAPAAPTFAGQPIQNPQVQAQAPVRPEMPVPPQPQAPPPQPPVCRLGFEITNPDLWNPST